MSDDLKFWCVRFLYWAVLGIDSLLFGEVFEAGISNSPHLKLWGIVFFAAIIASLPVALMYYQFRRRRWGEGHKTQEQYDVETLAAYAAMQQKEASVKAGKNPPQKTN